MAKFGITLTETVTYEIVLEADSLYEAELEAKEIWANALAAQQEALFSNLGHGVEVTDSWKVDP